jgi:GDPmannose 4,6-dehydratase
LFACNGILFNHSGERRGKTFILRKITSCFAEIKAGKRDFIEVGNLEAKRDIGYAKEYVEGMWLMLQQDEPDDYVLATGKMYSIRELIEKTAKYAGFNIVWEGEGVDEKGYDKESGKMIVKINPRFFRPAEVDLLQGDATKAKEKLGWTPKTSIDELIQLMLKNDIEEVG